MAKDGKTVCNEAYDPFPKFEEVIKKTDCVILVAEYIVGVTIMDARSKEEKKITPLPKPEDAKKEENVLIEEKKEDKATIEDTKKEE